MTSSASPSANGKFSILSWQIVILQVLALAAVAILLNKPVGSLSGQIALEQEGFDLYSYDMRGHRVYAMAIGPRDGNETQRGVWVDKEGRFQIDNLPVGEYSLKLRVPGFSTTYESGLFVQDGKVTRLPEPVLLDIAQPNVSVASNSRVFTTKDHPKFWANVSNANSLTVKVFSKDLLEMLKQEKTKDKLGGVEISPDLSIYKPYDSKGDVRDILAKFKPLKEMKRKISGDWEREDFELDSLPPGDYFVLAESYNLRKETDWGLTWFSVTDVGLIVKQDDEKVVARAIDLNTLKPLSDVKVALYDRSSSSVLPYASAQTAADGFCTVTAASGGRPYLSGNVLVMGTLGTQHAYGGLNIYQGGQVNHNSYFYTERPVYRLGQTVYFKGIDRVLTAGGFRNEGAGRRVKVTFEDPDNQELWTGTLKTSAHGTFNGVLEIPADGKTGAYQVTLEYEDGSRDYQRVEVLQYRKPEYKVEVTPLEKRVTAGQKARARIRATYYFGAPVTNAKVKYSIYSATDWSSRYRLEPRPDYYAYFDDWNRNDDSDYYYGGEFVGDGEVQTDETGEAIVEFDTQPVDRSPDSIFSGAYTDRKYKVDVEVTDISRLSVLNSGSIQVTAGEFALFVNSSSYVVPVGEKLGATVSAISYEGQPMNNTSVKVQLLRRVYDRVKHEYKGVQVFEEQTVTTDNSGQAKTSFNTQAKYETDTYYIVALASDAGRHQLAASDSVWVSSPDYPYYAPSGEEEKHALDIKLDKPVYKPGEVARVMITAPVSGKEGAQAILTIEGMKLYNYKTVDLKATATMVEIPVKASYAPNIHIGAVFVGKKHQFYSQTAMLKVTPDRNFLNIDITTDKRKYNPGDNATYTIKVKDADGKPAPNVELSLGVVDESIYAIRPEVAGDIRKFFYQQRPNRVNTLCTFPEEYSGGPNKIEPRVRKDFRDTAVWKPQLVTNSAGIAQTTIKLPDNLTTWRATVRGVSRATDVGFAIQKVVSTQDLIVRLALPRFFCQGDEGQISAIVHNYSDISQNVALTLALSPQITVSKALAEKVKVDPEKAVRVSWPAKVITAGTATIGIKAVGQTAGDAMETRLPVRPLGVPVYISRSGYCDRDSESIAIPLSYPQDAAEGSIKATLSLSSSSLGPILGNFSSLIDYPYGCTEQTMSKLMPAVVAMKMNKVLGIPLPAADFEKFQKVYGMGIEKLYQYHHSDGGWGWWATDDSNMYLTSLVLEGFKLLKENGYDVEDDRIKQGLNWLSATALKAHKQMTDPKLVKSWWRESELMTDLAQASYIMTLYGKKLPDDLRTWVNSDAVRLKLSPESLAYFTIALKKSGHAEQAQAMYERLVSLANVTGTQDSNLMNWERSKEMYAKYRLKENEHCYYDSYRFTGVETSALALRACLAMEPSNTARIESIKSFILTQRGKDGWGNTKTTSEVFRAFMEAETAGAKSGTNFAASIGGAPAGESFQFDSSSAMQPETKMPLDLARGPVTIKKSGSGRLYWTATLTYYKRLKPGDRSLLQSAPTGVSMKREFFRLVPEKDKDGNVHFKQVELKGAAKAGETLLMRILVDLPTTVPYTILEAALPSGAEVVSKDPREEMAESSSSDSDGEIETDFNWWWNHQDILDDKIAYFVTAFPNGKREIRTMLRLELPGRFQMNPVTLEGMYTDRVRGYSEASEITVTE